MQPSLPHYSYLQTIWRQFLRHKLGVLGLSVVLIYVLAAVYAPFLASSKPLAVKYDGVWYFPLFKYLFFRGFYTKPVDLFFNLLMITLPLAAIILLALQRGRVRKRLLTGIAALQIAAFAGILFGPVHDPEEDSVLIQDRQAAIKAAAAHNLHSKFPIPLPNRFWQFDLAYMNSYKRLELVLQNIQQQERHQALMRYAADFGSPIPSLWQIKQAQEAKALAGYEKEIHSYAKEAEMAVFIFPLILQLPESPFTKALFHALNRYIEAELNKQYIEQKNTWLKEQEQLVAFKIMPLISHYHWEEDAGGTQSFNQYAGWLDLTRVNRKDLTAALIFGARVSLVVGIVAIAIALIIGVPIGAWAGYYGGYRDIVISRLLEVWESMPTFFMLLLVVAMLQSKSIFLVIAVIGLFGWTGFCRFTRGEFFKQRNLAYIEACKSQGFSDKYIMFTHILPNAIPPVLTLLPFAIMGAMTSEAGLSFLGLGEEGSSSWGVLMDEGRNAFPGESYLLWPPALLLTILLVAIALVGDALRDSIDPKLHVNAK